MTNEHESAPAPDTTIPEPTAEEAVEQASGTDAEAVAPAAETTETQADTATPEPTAEDAVEQAGGTDAEAVAPAAETDETQADTAVPATEQAGDVSADAVAEQPAEAPDKTDSTGAAVESAKKAPTKSYEPTVISAQAVEDLPDDLDFTEAIERTVIEFDEGDIVEGTVASVDQDSVLVDIGYKSEGVIPAHELSIRRGVSPDEVVQVGDRIEALVLDKEDDEGRLILSKKRAQYERAWGRIQKIFEEGGTVKGPVIEVVKGGLIVDIGLRGFLPASLVELRRVRDLEPYIGQEIEAKVIELDRNRNNVVLSRRAYLEDQQAEERQAFLDDLKEGEIRTGKVSSVVNFGAFVDLGGMDGLVHVSELSYQHVNHPSEVVKVGDEVTVKVLEVDLDRERISLSMRQTKEDPWEAFARAHEVGDVVEGTVTKTVPFGAFVSVGEGVEGLVHVSEIAVHRVESPELELSIGQKVKVKVTEMDNERRRVSLSIKQALPDWKDRQEQQQSRSRGPQPPRRQQPRVREFEREQPEEKERERAFDVDASLEAILQELKERGIGRR